jgi:prepilin-type processing-associated H-X9-DG protein/prepilin-type N-terminal cleavage/methylation domain-containing protein
MNSVSRSRGALRAVPRSGYSLLELLVVLGIMAILMGLLIPAVQKIRDVANRGHCQNNLKQLSLALHQFHDSHGTLPMGHRSASSGVFAYTGWSLALLPYLERSREYADAVSAFAANPSPFVDPPHQHLKSVVSAYQCRSDRRVATPQIARLSNKPVGLMSYLGVSGLDLSTRDGVLVQDAAIKLTAITDGLSHTLVLGERPPRYDHQFGWWYAGTGQLGTGSGDIILGVEEKNILPIFAPPLSCQQQKLGFADTKLAEPCAMFHYWSLHPNGANFAFCDGSVHFLRYTSKTILAALASRAGGEGVVYDESSF